MTEVAGLLLPADHRLTTVRHYEAGPPEGLELVEPGETFATTKEEEWVSKKKTEVINTKQIETRVKRQVVLEDGKVVEDSGPQVTTNTTEDSETQEHHQTELRKLGDGSDKEEDAPTTIKTPVRMAANADGLVREVKEKRVVSREETEEVKEMEDVQHFGDITDEAFISAVNTGTHDLRPLLRSAAPTTVSTGPRLVHQSHQSRTTTDTEDKRDSSSLLPNGKIITESERTTARETTTDRPLAADEPDRAAHAESTHRYFKSLHQLDDAGGAMRTRTEHVELERSGAAPEEARKPLDRKDALTRRPLDFDQEEETRKVETNKWLEHHFGSESRSSSTDGEDERRKTPPKTSFFNVTIRSSEGGTNVGGKEQNVKKVTVTTPERDTAYYKGISQWRPVEVQKSPSPDYYREKETPTPPARKRTSERRHQVAVQKYGYEREAQDEVGRFTPPSRLQPEEPPPDYSPPGIVNGESGAFHERKVAQKTRFAPDPPKAKSGNIIGQSIRKLVGKIRSASAERKAKQRAKRSPSPSYQKGHIIDNNITTNTMEQRKKTPSVQRYYLGEDPFAGSIYGRENKYDSVKPIHRNTEQRSQSTLGRFAKPTGRTVHTARSSQTLPRRLPRADPSPLPKASSTINVSIVNTLAAPAKPARALRPSLTRSQSLTQRLHESARLESPALISSLVAQAPADARERAFMRGLQQRAPELFETLEARRGCPGDIYEPPTRLRDSHAEKVYAAAASPPPPASGSALRRGSNSSTDYSETYHTTTRNDDPKRPSVTNTVKSFTKKTIPGRAGRGVETIESSEVKSVTKSSYRSNQEPGRFYESGERRYGATSPVVIEVRNNGYSHNSRR